MIDLAATRRTWSRRDHVITYQDLTDGDGLAALVAARREQRARILRSRRDRRVRRRGRAPDGRGGADGAGAVTPPPPPPPRRVRPGASRPVRR